MPKNKSVCEPKVYEEVYATYSRDVYNFAFYKCGNSAQAEDIVQEAFIKLWNNCIKVLFEKSKSFLFTVANNLFLNEMAHKKVVLKFNQTPVSDSTIESPEFLLEEKEFLQKLQTAISSLNEKQRVVFLLSRIEKKTYKEIGEICEISVKAVEKRMHLALSFLRKKIGDI